MQPTDVEFSLHEVCVVCMIFLHKFEVIIVSTIHTGIMFCHSSGSFRAARLPRQATRAVRAVGLWVEINPVPPSNCRVLDCLLFLLSEDSAPSSRKTI